MFLDNKLVFSPAGILVCESNSPKDIVAEILLTIFLTAPYGCTCFFILVEANSILPFLNLN